MPDAAVARLVGFGRHLRRAGLPVGTNRILTFCRSVGVLVGLDAGDVPGPARSQILRDRLYWAGRASLVAHPDHLETYDEAFARYFGEAELDEALQALLGSSAPSEIKVEVEQLVGNEQQQSLELDETEGTEQAVLRMV